MGIFQLDLDPDIDVTKCPTKNVFIFAVHGTLFLCTSPTTRTSNDIMTLAIDAHSRVYVPDVKQLTRLTYTKYDPHTQTAISTRADADGIRFYGHAVRIHRLPYILALLNDDANSTLQSCGTRSGLSGLAKVSAFVLACIPYSQCSLWHEVHKGDPMPKYSQIGEHHLCVFILRCRRAYDLTKLQLHPDRKRRPDVAPCSMSLPTEGLTVEKFCGYLYYKTCKLKVYISTSVSSLSSCSSISCVRAVAL